MSIRPIKQIIESRPTIEGAGVKLRRAFGFGETEKFDPFLLFDDFRNEKPEDFLAGFPWHPHRALKPSRMFSQVPFITATVWGIKENLPRETSSG